VLPQLLTLPKEHPPAWRKLGNVAQGTFTDVEEVRNSALAKNWSEHKKIHKSVTRLSEKCFSSYISPTKFEVGTGKSLKKNIFIIIKITAT
jgi:hypothetical protein